ncbi:hypothetical protein ABH940_000114 [Streptacidiphilus sp. BW17]|uniref:DUF2637 domain-containing protein n=1 Tax=Streptacidiphilus sp. BW17 TaxID=3156274 RepID=UPI0035156B32
MSDHVISAQPPASTGRHRATWWDRLAIVLLGVAACSLSYDSLRQMATAVHVRPTLTYLFPVVIDGFIAYGVRALLVLREAPRPARLYAWTLFIAATAASIWANGLHALDLNRPGTVALHLDDTTVTVLSSIAPLALAGATHLHILITRYGGTTESAAVPRSGTRAGVQDRPQPVPERSAEVPNVATRAALVVGTQPLAGHGDPDEHDDKDRIEQVHAGQEPEKGSGPPPVTNAGGRPPKASIAELAEAIRAAHPEGSGLTRASARKAVTDAGFGASTDRLTAALALVKQSDEARQHPDN